jgi:hypothetical protein
LQAGDAILPKKAENMQKNTARFRAACEEKNGNSAAPRSLPPNVAACRVPPEVS